jgi:hypothetical protein
VREFRQNEPDFLATRQNISVLAGGRNGNRFACSAVLQNGHSPMGRTLHGGVETNPNHLRLDLSRARTQNEANSGAHRLGSRQWIRPLCRGASQLFSIFKELEAIAGDIEAMKRGRFLYCTLLGDFLCYLCIFVHGFLLATGHDRSGLAVPQAVFANRSQFLRFAVAFRPGNY